MPEDQKNNPVLPPAYEEIFAARILFELYAPMLIAAACRVMNPTDPGAAVTEWRSSLQSIIDNASVIPEPGFDKAIHDMNEDTWNRVETHLHVRK